MEPEYSGDFLVRTELQQCLQVYPLQLKHWQLLEVIHQSENSIIFLARHLNRQQYAAIKRFKIDIRGLDHTYLESFLNVYRELGLTSSKGLVQLLDAGCTEDAMYLVMEYIAGETLKSRLLNSPLPKLEARVRWFQEITSILQIIHETGWLHGDLKTSNILIREDGSLVLLDFGLENHLLVKIGFLREDEIYCTPYYVSPERIMGDIPDESADLYALGIILYELLVAKKPYEAETLEDLLKKHALAPIPKLPKHLKMFQPLLNRLLAKFPESRLRSAEDVLNMLDTLVLPSKS